MLGLGRRRAAAKSVQRRNYTAARQSILEQAAGGKVEADASKTAVLEACAGLASRAFACAMVDGSPAVTPEIMGLVGRQLVQNGECVLLIDTSRGRIELLPVAFWDVQGGANPADWWYRCDVYGPSGNATSTIPAAGVVHAKWSWDPAFPWRGVGPLQRAEHSGKLIGALSKSLAEEAGTPGGFIVPTPDIAKEETGQEEDDADSPLQVLATSLKSLAGGLALVPTVASGFGSRTEAPKDDWKQVRLGPNPPAPLIALMDEGAREVMAACGVPVDLLVKSDGATLRESWRRFVHSTIQPLGKLVAAELSAKLEAEVRFDFSGLHASDVAGRARAFGILVGNGVAAADAMKVSGLDELE